MYDCTNCHLYIVQAYKIMVIKKVYRRTLLTFHKSIAILFVKSDGNISHLRKGVLHMKKHSVKRTALSLSVATTLVAVSSMPAATVFSAAAANNTAFPYTMFAASTADGAITVNAKHFCINGSLAANGSIVTEKKANINGAKKENVGGEMIFVGDKLTAKYFSKAQTSDAVAIKQSNVNVNAPLCANGTASLEGNINLNSAVKAGDDISVKGNVMNASNAVFYSAYGDISIDCNNVNLGGIIYAPLGTVTIDANNINLNNAVIIADSIVLNANNVNANYGQSGAQVIGTESEDRAAYFRQYHSWMMDNDINDTIDLISQYYTLKPVDTGEFANLTVMGMPFAISQYEVEGYGNLSIMKLDSAMQMSTIVLTPFEKELPLISTDFMYNGEQHISYIEFYGLCAEENSADFQSVINSLNSLNDKYSGLMSMAPTPAWYDEIRTMGLFKVTDFHTNPLTSEMLHDSLAITLEASKNLPQFNAEQKAAKLAATQAYSNNLVDRKSVV